MEYELLDTGVFNGDRYFDVFVEVAKQSPEDLPPLTRVIWHSANLPCSSGSNAELTVFLIVGQAMVDGRRSCARTRPESGNERCYPVRAFMFSGRYN